MPIVCVARRLLRFCIYNKWGDTPLLYKQKLKKRCLIYQWHGCKGATFARSLTSMPLIHQDYLSPSLAKARPLRPQGAHVFMPIVCVAHRSPRSLRSLISWSLRGLFYPPPAQLAARHCGQGANFASSVSPSPARLATSLPIRPQRGLPN